MKIINWVKKDNQFPKEWEIWNCYFWQNIWSEQWWEWEKWTIRPWL